MNQSHARARRVRGVLIVRRTFIFSILGLCFARPAVPQAAAPTVKAFPTAEGFGADAKGGRGGRVIEVTTLDDSGP